MQSVMSELMEQSSSGVLENKSFCVGQIIQITDKGRALVDYPGNQTGPVEARSVVEKPSSRRHEEGPEGMPVLLVFENQDPALPIIIGFVRETLFEPTPPGEVAINPQKPPHNASLDGKKMVLDAKEEIVLQCGKSSITLSKNGKIVIRGANLLSRSSGPNRIKGTSVNIN